MNSSRLRTVRCSSCLPERGVCPGGGGCLPREVGDVCPGVSAQGCLSGGVSAQGEGCLPGGCTPPSVDRILDTHL